MPAYGKLFKNGRSQAVRLPAQFRFPGERVRVSRHGNGVLLEPVADEAAEWFAALDRFADPFMPDGREQLPAPDRKVFP